MGLSAWQQQMMLCEAGPLPPAWEAQIEFLESWLQCGPSRAIGGLWEMSQQVRPLPVPLLSNA